jgi:hypothetical protein
VDCEHKRFAWWPVKVTSGRWVWLNILYQHKLKYDRTTGRPPLNSLHFLWTETPVERTWRLLKEANTHNSNSWNELTLTEKDKQCQNNNTI